MRHLSGLRRLTILEAGLYAMYSADDPQRDARIASAESGELPAEFLTPLDQLRVLDLSGRAVGDVHIKHINAPHLWKVHLDNTPAGDGAAERISRLPAINVISMNATRVTDVGARAIAHNRAVKSVGLAYTAVTDAAIADLAALPALEQLKVGNREHPERITGKGVLRLRAARALKLLCVYDATLSTEEIRAIEAALPGVWIACHDPGAQWIMEPLPRRLHNKTRARSNEEK